MIQIIKQNADRRAIAAFGFLVLFCFILLLVAGVAGAQEVRTDFERNPLRPPDTSSPRDTLRSFMTNANVIIKEWRASPDAISSEGFKAYHDAVETLDLSTTPDGDSRSVRARRLLLLKEILDRIDLPPGKEIPGLQEVADEAITRWTIPNTRITIGRIEHGPRAGEYLFSSDSVQRLDRMYRKTKHLPYKPDASPGIYESYLRSERRGDIPQSQVRIRLRSVDTSNPRSTLEGFLDSVNEAYELVMDAADALKATPSTMTKKEAREIEAKAKYLLLRAMATLDLSQVPEALRQATGFETVLQLKEIFDRTNLPPVDSIPNTQIVEAKRQQGSGESSPSAGPFRWRYPDTDIDIVEIIEGERQGQFLFSAGSVSRISSYYKEIWDLPYRKDDYGPLSLEYVSPATSKGFYEYYISTPGALIPRATLLGRLLDELPIWLTTVLGGQMIWQWIALILCLLVVALGAYVVFRFIRAIARPLNSPMDDWLMLLSPIIVAVIVSYVVGFIHYTVNVTGDALAVVKTAGRIAIIVMVAWAAFILCKAVAETVIASPRIWPIREQSLDASLWRIGARIVGFLLVSWIVIDGIQDLGADVIPLLAGLGVGGLAVALAAQKTVANFIGSLILFGNKPVRVGDFCRYGDEIGTVEEIGLISTRIRSLERTIVTVPNAIFSDMQLDNFTKRDQRLLRTRLPLHYETTMEQLRYILAKLRELLLGHPMVTPDPARVRFLGFGAFSLDLEVFAYLRCREQNDFLALQEDILLRMADIVKEAGTSFAFASQRAYLGRAAGLDPERQREAEVQVEQWREEGKLPFPEFEREERRQLEDTLDYPPKGSPTYKPQAELSEPQPEPEPNRPYRWFGFGPKRP